MAWKIKEVWRRTGKPKSSLSFLPWPRTNRTHFSCCSWVSFGQSAFVLKSLKEKTLKQNFCYHRTIFWSLRWINAALGFGGKIIEVLNKYSQVSFQWGGTQPCSRTPPVFSCSWRWDNGKDHLSCSEDLSTYLLNYATKKEVGMRQLSPKEAEE